MQNEEFAASSRKLRLTYFKAMFSYAATAGLIIFLTGTGILQKLVAWNQSVFVSTILMVGVMIFYFRRTMQRAERISLEKDTLDFLRKRLESPNAGSSEHQKLLFCTDEFFKNGSEEDARAGTFVADYFRSMGKRIRVIRVLASEAARPDLIKSDDLQFCFYADMERLIKPIVNAGRKLLLFGFLGTVVGILLIGVGMRFGETAQQTLLIAKELIAGLGVAALTTILGIIGNLILSSFYEQHEDIRDRIAGELTRITSVYGLDLYPAPYLVQKKDGDDG